MADHVAVWMGCADEPVFAGSYSLDHLGLLFPPTSSTAVRRKRRRVSDGISQYVSSSIAELAAPVAVPEVCHVAVLLGLEYGKLHAGFPRAIQTKCS